MYLEDLAYENAMQAFLEYKVDSDGVINLEPGEYREVPMMPPSRKFAKNSPSRKFASNSPARRPSNSPAPSSSKMLPARRPSNSPARVSSNSPAPSSSSTPRSNNFRRNAAIAGAAAAGAAAIGGGIAALNSEGAKNRRQYRRYKKAGGTADYKTWLKMGKPSDIRNLQEAFLEGYYDAIDEIDYYDYY